MGTAGTLPNRAKSGFVRTPPDLAVQIGKHILDLPDEEFNVYDPTSGEGDFFYACAHAQRARYFGSEISAERAAVSRQRWPNALIVTSACEAVNIQGTFQLILTNAPYFFQNGKRAPYRITVDVGERAEPGTIHANIMSARSDWDTWMINHWLTWYERVRVWKFANRSSTDEELAFDDYYQILVVGRRRATPAQPSEAERSRLQGYQWKVNRDNPEKSWWRHGSPPPDIPTSPIADPYPVPSAHGQVPRLIVRNADEATLLAALDKAGAHLSAAWQQATTWEADTYSGPPAMPYTGEAHIASEVMIGGLDGETVWGPGSGVDAQPHIFTAFIGKEWVEMPVEDELKEKLREDGCIRVEMKQLVDKPILGVLNLLSGRTRYYQGEEVFDFLQPWIPTLASRVIAKRKPLYRLDPATWEIRVLSQFGTDKRLPNAEQAGLTVAQLHRVFAMCRLLDVKGRSAIQGEPGTGKTRLATGAAKRQAYRWRYRTSEFRHAVWPAWMRKLRRAWLKNPATLAMLDLEPVSGWRFNQGTKTGATILEHSPNPAVFAYRERATGKLVRPEDAGPRALPVLITTPLKVTREYGKEILAAFPRAEVVPIESHRDIPRWLERCAHSERPVVFGIISHSLTRAFGREKNEVVREKRVTVREPVLDPPDDLLPLLEPVREGEGRKQKIVGYRFKEGGGDLLTREVQVSYFYCCTCGARIDAVPGKLDQRDDEGPKKKRGKPGEAANASEGKEEKAEENLSPVTSRTFFKRKLRWCRCADRRNQDRREEGKSLLRSPLWQEERTEAAQRKHPQASLASFSRAFSALQHTAQRALAGASSRELVERVRRDNALLTHLVEVAIFDVLAAGPVLDLVERIDGHIAHLRREVVESHSSLSSLLLSTALHDEAFLASLLRDSTLDETRFARLVQIGVEHDSALARQLTLQMEQWRRAELALVKQVAMAVQMEGEVLSDVVGRLVMRPSEATEAFLDMALSYEPSWASMVGQWQREENWRQLVHFLTKIVQRHDDLVRTVVAWGWSDVEIRQALLIRALENDPTVAEAVEGLRRNREGLLALVTQVAGRHEVVARAVIAETLVPVDEFPRLLTGLAVRDLRSLKMLVSGVEACQDEIERLAAAIKDGEAQIAERVMQAARRDSSQSIVLRLVEQTRSQVDWQRVFFRLAYEQAHFSAPQKQKKRGGTSGTALDATAVRGSARGVRLAEVEGEGPIIVEEIDRGAARGYDALRDENGRVVAYQLGHQGKTLVPIYGRWSRRVIAYADTKTGKVVTRKVSYDFRLPPGDSFSPFDYLYQFFPGCVAMAVVDESHNGRGRRTDIGQSHHFAMLASAMRMMTSGTHFGGDITGIFHYWFRFNPQFWLARGYGWEDGEKALTDYGVIEQWLKEYEREGDSRRGSGKSDIYVTTVAGPGISANLIPPFLEDLTYLTVLDVGAHMPPKVEIPKAISLKDPLLEAQRKEVDQLVTAAAEQVAEVREERSAAALAAPAGPIQQALLAQVDERVKQAQAQLTQVCDRRATVGAWVTERNLEAAYEGIVSSLESMAQEGDGAARLALGTIPRLFLALPCDSPFRVYRTPRSAWGDKLEPELVIETPVLAWDYIYPLERWFQEVARDELREGRRVMFYIEQVTRSMARRLEYVLAEFNPWSLPASVEAEERQQAILDAVERGHHVVIVPYKKVNEGLNLQTAIDTIVWAELAMNLFYYIQASQRAWRLGKEVSVKIYTPYYLGSTTHKKVRSIGGRDGAAAVFSGEAAKGGLAHHVGADQTTLARIAAQIEQGEQAELDRLLGTVDDSAEIEANFARRNQELAEALRRGRQWFGVVDTLPERLAAVLAAQHPDVWAVLPHMVYLPDTGVYTLEAPVAVGVRLENTLPDQREEKPGDAAEQPAVAIPTALAEEPAPGLRIVVEILSGQQSVTVTFGDEEDIRRVRKTRASRPRRTSAKLKHPTTVKEIPAFDEQALLVEARQPESPLRMASIWDADPNGGY